MKAKSLLIPVAAFAVTATGVSAYNPEILEKVGLSDTQIAAFEEAHEFKQNGDREAAKEVLLDAGVDLETLKQVRAAHKEQRQEKRAAVKATLEAKDFEAFQEVAGERLLEKITSEADFALLVDAQQLREAGDREAAKEIMSELGFEKKHRGKHHGEGKRGTGDRSDTN